VTPGGNGKRGKTGLGLVAFLGLDKGVPRFRDLGKVLKIGTLKGTFTRDRVRRRMGGGLRNHDAATGASASFKKGKGEPRKKGKEPPERVFSVNRSFRIGDYSWECFSRKNLAGG